MAFELIYREMLAHLIGAQATQKQIADYDALWNEAMNRPGDPLPCPSCFLEGKTERMKPGKDTPMGEHGSVFCESCNTRFRW